MDYEDARSAISADLVAGTVTGDRSGNDTVSRFNSIIGSSFDDVMIDGGLYTYNRFIGGPGNDEMTLGGGQNTAYGGDGDDHIVAGFSYYNYLYGDDGDDVIEAGDGHSRMRGEDGDDTLIGGSGNDGLHGGEGTDFGDGGPGEDTCVDIEKEIPGLRSQAW